MWQQKYLLQPTPLFCDSQVRNLYELKINEILQSAAKNVFYWLTCDTPTCQLCIPLILAVFFPPRWVSRRCARVVFASDSEEIDASVQLFFLLFLVSGRTSTMCCASVCGQAMQWVSISPRSDVGQNSCPVKLSPQELSDREVNEQASYGAHIAKSWNVELSLGRFFIVSQDVWIVVLICVVVVSRYGFLGVAYLFS